MTEPHDDLDAWLHAEVEPLRPPPGTFERIRKQARRRKARHALMTAASAGAAAAVITVAVVALPRVVPSVLHLKPSRPVAGQTVVTPSGAYTPATRTASPRRHSTTRPASSGGLPPVPPDFAATSVTFVSLDTGWVIGQAGTPGHCYTQYCTSVARTDDAGHTWYGLHAPLTGAPDGAAGVGQIRFLDTADGWAFGPELWATHDGGSSWARVPLGGLRVIGLETAGTEAFAVVGDGCTGAGPAFADGCSRLGLWSSPAGADHWGPVPGVPWSAAPSGAAGSAAIVLGAGTGYFYAPSGLLYSGPDGSGGSWARVGSAALPCQPGAPGLNGQPASGHLAVASTGHLALGCPGGGSGTGQSREAIYLSADGGLSWLQQGTVRTAAAANSLAATSAGTLVLGSGDGIYTSATDGLTWTRTLQGPAGGFGYVGMTAPSQGVAVPAESQYHAVWFTYDGGVSWQASPVSGG